MEEVGGRVILKWTTGVEGGLMDSVGEVSFSVSEKETRALVCEFLALFYNKGWIAGTGGGICARLGELPEERNLFLMAPTGVHKERVLPPDLFVVDQQNGAIVRPPQNKQLRLSECHSIFLELIHQRGAGAVLHSHALSAVMVSDLAQQGDPLVVSHLEMIKGLRGGTNQDRHLIPVIGNMPHEPELLAGLRQVLDQPQYEKSYCILVRDHGAYIWGKDIWETKQHAEVYHFLFEAIFMRHER